jgi:hypothetical protein
MSTATALPSERGLPTPVSNLLASWWLAIGFACSAAFLSWFDLLPWERWGRLQVLTFILLFLGIAAVIGIGGWIGHGIRQGFPTALGRCRLFSLIGTILGLVLVLGYMIVKFSTTTPVDPEAPDVKFSYAGGANIFLVCSLIAALVLPPLLFGLFTWSLSMRDDVERFFYPPAPEEPAVARAAVVEPVVAEVEAVTTYPPTEESAAVAEAIEAQEARLAEQASVVEALEIGEAVHEANATPTALPFNTDSLQLESSGADPFETTSASGKNLSKLAQQALRLDPAALEGSVVEAAVDPSEESAATEESESLSADVADDGSESVLLADDEASALLASTVEDKPSTPSKTSTVPPIPMEIDEPLSVGDMELTFDDDEKKDQK